jgi:hypothetical protein
MSKSDLQIAHDKFVRNGIAVHVPAVKELLTAIEKHLAEDTEHFEKTDAA